MSFQTKILTMIISIIFFMNSIGTSNGALYRFVGTQTSFAEEPEGQGEVLDSKLREVVNFLTGMGVIVGYEDGTFRPNNTITRAEFSAIVIRMLKLQDAANANTASSPFLDVAQDHWALGSINIAYNMGIIIGHGDGTFAPEDDVTYEQAIKMLVCALGYEQMALERGTYPNGYLSAAAYIGLLKDITGNVGEPAKRGLVAMAVYNAMNLKIPEQVVIPGNIGSGGSSGSGGRGGSSISDTFEKRTGVVTANYDISLSDSAPVRKDEVEIDGKVYGVGKTNIADYVGYYVVFYVNKEKNSEKETIVSFETDRNRVISVDAENIEPETNMAQLVYWENKVYDSKPKTEEISENVKVIVNGKISPLKENTLKPEIGKLKLIDNDRNGYIDVIYVTSYKLYVVDSKNISANLVYPKYGKEELELNFNSNSYILTMEKDGQRLTSIASLSEWDVLAVAESENIAGKKIKHVIVTRNKISGVITESDGEQIYIGTKAYKLAPNSYNGELPEIDDRVDLYMTFDNKIAALYKYTVTEKGYLIKIFENSGVNEQIDLQFLSLNGTSKVIKASGNILYNNGQTEKTIDSKQLIEQLGGSNMLPQLVEYELNGLGALKKMILPIDNVSGTYNLEQFSKDYVSENAVYKRAESSNAADTFEGRYRITGTTKIIFVPYGEKRSNINYYKTSYSFVNGGRYSIEIYDLDKLDGIGVLIVKETENMPKPLIQDQPLSIVSDVSTINGEYRMKYWQSGSEYSKYLEDKTVAEQVYRGDIVQFSTNEEGRIDNLIIFTPTEEDFYTVKDRSEYTGETNASGIKLVYGEVYDMDFKNNIISVKVGDNDIFNYQVDSSSKIYEIDNVQQKIYSRNLGDIHKEIHKKVFMRVLDRTIKDIILYKQES